MRPCQGRDRGFESRRSRQRYKESTIIIWQIFYYIYCNLLTKTVDMVKINQLKCEVESPQYDYVTYPLLEIRW